MHAVYVRELSIAFNVLLFHDDFMILLVVKLAQWMFSTGGTFLIWRLLVGNCRCTSLNVFHLDTAV